MNLQRLKMAWRVLTGRADRRLVYLLVPDEFGVAPHVFGNAAGVARAIEGTKLAPSLTEIEAMKVWDWLPADEESIWLVPAPAFDFTDIVRYNRLTVIQQTVEGGTHEREQFPRSPVAYTGGHQASTYPQWPDLDSRADHQLPLPGSQGSAYRGKVYVGAELQGRTLPDATTAPTVQEVRQDRRADEDDQEILI